MNTDKINQWFDQMYSELRTQQYEWDVTYDQALIFSTICKRTYGDKFSLESVKKQADTEKQKLEDWIQNLRTNVQPKFLELVFNFPEPTILLENSSVIRIEYDIDENCFCIQCYWMHDQFLFYKNRKQSSKQELVDALKHTI